MNLNNYRHTILGSAIVLTLTACGGSGGNTPNPLRFSGPLALQSVPASAVSDDGTVGIAETLTNFPQTILDDFNSRFPGHVVESRYRKLMYAGGNPVSEVFGVEAEGSAESTEIEASYNTDGSFVSSMLTEEDTELPSVVTDIVNSLYPEFELYEASRLTSADTVVTYKVEIESSESELELLIDANGILLSTVEEISSQDVPTTIIENSQLELGDYSEVKYEKRTQAIDGGVFYEIELESSTESVSAEYDANGAIVSMQFEEELD